MDKIISFERARETQRAQRTTFWKLVNSHLRADLERKRLLLHSLGNQSAALREVTAEADRGGDHVTVMFTGAGQLKGYSFSFVIRDVPERNALRAEIWAINNVATDLLTKTISEISSLNYDRRWLDDCYNSAMDLLAPPAPAESMSPKLRSST